MDDLISRRAALEICEKEYQERLKMFDYCGDTVAWNIGGDIKLLPTVDAEPVRHGRWIKIDERSPIFLCSECQKTFPYKTDFCPNCGAKMDKEG